MNKSSEEKFASSQLGKAFKSIQSIYRSCPDLSKKQLKPINKAMDSVDTAQHKIIGKDMAYFYKDKLDSELRMIATYVFNHKINSAYKAFDEAKKINENHVDHDEQLYIDIKNILSDVLDVINLAKGDCLDDDVYSNDVRNSVKQFDMATDYNCGVLD